MHHLVLFGNLLMQSFQLLCVVLTLGLQMSIFVRCEHLERAFTAGFMVCFSCLLYVVN